MAGVSNYQKDIILDDLFSGSVYAGFSLADPLDDESGLDEPVGGDYARVEIAPADWAAAASGSKANANAITFAAPTGNWGTVTHLCLFDAAVAGNLLYHCELVYPKEVLNGGTAPEFAAGDLIVTID